MPQRTRSQRLNGLFPLSYTGVIPVSPVNFIMDDRDPTMNDSKNFYIGDMWLNITSSPPEIDDLWMLVSLAGNNATWVNFGAGDVESLTGNIGGPVFPDAGGNINVLGDTTTILVTGNPGTNTLTISAVGTGLVSTLTGNAGGAVPPTAGNINVLGDTTTITITGNPGTSTLTASTVGTGVMSSLTGDVGGPVFPLAGNTNIVGDAATGVLVTGNPGTHTLTISGGGGAINNVTTNDATPTPIRTIPMVAGQAIDVNCIIIGAKADYSAAIGGRLNGCARRAAIGGAVLIGSPISDFSHDSAGSPNFTLTVAGNDVIVTVIGEAATVYNWESSTTTVVV